MPTYVYETIPAKSGARPRQYEIRHGIKEAALTRHPETGEPIRRVLAAGASVLTSSRTAGSPRPTPSAGGCCGGSCGCAH